MDVGEAPLNYRERISLRDELSDASLSGVPESPDRRDGRVYVFDPAQKFAAEVALVTGRPLLLRGRPGSGKSSFAAFLARNLGWRYFEYVTTARTQARDLLWTFDAVRRLGDAQTRRTEGTDLYDFDYVEPGVLWWAINPGSAVRRGAPEGGRAPSRPAQDPCEVINVQRPHRDRAVVLIDEIDKADPDVPNNLLVALGSYEFQIEETGTRVSKWTNSTAEANDGNSMARILVIITTNEERDLPLAFVRRCVIYTLGPPSPDRLVEIAERHFQSQGRPVRPQERELFERIAARVVELRELAESRDAPGPSTAEYLDAVRACRELGVAAGEAGGEAWAILERVVIRKSEGTDL